jgi:hypothetical protein
MNTSEWTLIAILPPKLKHFNDSLVRFAGPACGQFRHAEIQWIFRHNDVSMYRRRYDPQ